MCAQSRSIPLKIPVVEGSIQVPDLLVVRGEVFILRDEFIKLNRILEENGEKTYQNPRNTAAGSLRQLDPALTSTRPLTILTYVIVQSSEPLPATQWQLLETLRAYGFPVSSYCERVDTLQKRTGKIAELGARRDSIPFEVDGVVIKLDDLACSGGVGLCRQGSTWCNCLENTLRVKSPPF